MLFSYPKIPGILKNYEFMPLCVPIWKFLDLRSTMNIEYVEVVEHNSWIFEVHFDTFLVFQIVWGMLYLSRNDLSGVIHLFKNQKRS